MGHVIGLDLGSNWNFGDGSRIEGRIDPSLFHLRSLQKLNLSWGDFYPSTIPSGLGQLTNLTHLDLSNSGFLGQIPLEISSLTKLISLDLSQEFSSGPLELKNPSLTRLIQNLSSLRQLSLDQVTISERGGKWAQALSIALPNLQKLSLRFCGLGGPIDPSLFQLPFLSQISLDGNNLSIAVPNFLDNSSILTTLTLGGCGLYGNFPRSIFLLPRLQMLDISNNPNLTILLPEFPQNSALQYLYMEATRIDGKLPDSIGYLKFLKVLSLRNCNLFGSLPSSIANLSHLESLDLSANNISGMIPFSRANELQHLTRLNLDNNALEGSISPSLFSHPSLQVLSLSNNQLNDSLLDFHNVTSSVLELVYLDHNNLRGEIPRSIFELTKLTELVVSNNHFTGTVGLHMFQNIMNLINLDFSENNFTFINSNDSSHLISSSQISSLYLRSCNISKFPDILQNLSQLQTLDLSNNKIHGEIPSWIWKVGDWSLNNLNLSINFLESFEHPLPQFPSQSRLQIVDLHSNRLRGSLPVFPPQVYFQDYSNNSFSSVIPATKNFTLIQFFFLSNNNVGGEIPSSICEARSLRILNLSNNKFNGYLPTCLGETSNYLEILNLGGNDFQGNVPDMFKKNCRVRTLNLNRNRLEGPIPQSISSCKTLEVIDLGNNRLNDNFPFWLQNLSNLRILILRSNTFHGPIVHSHTPSPSFPFLQIFDISSNSFTGVVPSGFFLNWKLLAEEDRSNVSSYNQIVNHMVNGYYYQDSATVTMKGLDLEVVKILIALTSVDLSNNRFQGEIPKSICSLKLLRVLNLSHNGFSGPIPTSLEDLTVLESLDLSRNELSGSIPWQLTRLTFLAILNLSENLLHGAIPHGQQFLTFTDSSFLGNTGLCGLPLTKKCVDTTAPPPTFYGIGFHGNGEIDWKFVWIGSGVGFGFGFGAVFWTLALWRKGSKKYFQLIDRMFAHMFSH
eukprot:TRINITY_DN8669_c0_g1_i1.p1 TRINITY_DN8669_c0_g1~~TRINITY_DN8669_c0_g1_i1.p1  ORF type:complete len:1062 (+),score=128.23 TRINITY_DN8669_c0_g1_i1:307-3186(+)